MGNKVSAGRIKELTFSQMFITLLSTEHQLTIALTAKLGDDKNDVPPLLDCAECESNKAQCEQPVSCMVAEG